MFEGPRSRVPEMKRTFLVALAIGLLVRQILHYVAFEYYADDAYIFMRYAENSARQLGLVYNPGERILGFTSPTFALVLAALARLPDAIPLEDSVNVFNSLCFCVLAAVYVLISAREIRRAVAFAAVVLFYTPLVIGSINGMETTLFMVLQYVSVWLLLTRRVDAAIAAAALCGVTRPEGMLVFALVLGAVALNLKDLQRLPVRGALAGFALCALWALFAWQVYGSPIPQSMTSKSTLLGDVATATTHNTSPLDKWVLMAIGISDRQYVNLPAMVRAGVTLGVLIASVLASIATWSLVKKRSFAALIPAYFGASWVFYVVGNPVFMATWYVVPPALAFAWSALAGAFELVTVPRVARALTTAVVAGVLVSLPFGIYRQQESLREGITYALVGVTDLINTRFPGAQTIMIGDIGYVGYRTRARIIDAAGLVTPLSVLKDASGRERTALEIAARENVDIVVIGRYEGVPLLAAPSAEDWLAHGYREIDSPADYYRVLTRLP